jgi:hypothetical protein
MTERGRQLLKALAGRGLTRIEDLGMSQTEVAEAITDLGNIVDDDNRRVPIVKAQRIADRITAVELTAQGRGLAAHA